MGYLYVLMAGALGLSVSAFAAAEPAWPSRSVRVIVPVAAGGAADTLGRTITGMLSASLSQQFFIENRPGGGSIPGIEAVARADPDGYTLMVSGMSTHVLGLPMSKSAGLNPIRDFTHIAYIGGAPVVLVVHPSLNVTRLADFLSLAKNQGVEYVSPVFGSVGHLAGESLASSAGLRLRHVPYRGGGSAILDLVAGHVKAGFLTWSTVVGHMRTGDIIPLAVTAPRRLPDFPNLPTFAELGHGDLLMTSWFGLSGPANLPQHVTDLLNREVNAGMRLPDVRAALDRQSILTKPMTAAEFTAFVQSEVNKWAFAIKAFERGK